MLGDRHGDPGDIHLLEAVAPQEIPAHIARDRHNGDGIHICSGNPGNQIGGAGAGSRKYNAGLTGGTRIAVRRMGGALFMCGENMGNLVAVLV